MRPFCFLKSFSANRSSCNSNKKTGNGRPYAARSRWPLCSSLRYDEKMLRLHRDSVQVNNCSRLVRVTITMFYPEFNLLFVSIVYSSDALAQARDIKVSLEEDEVARKTAVSALFAHACTARPSPSTPSPHPLPPLLRIAGFRRRAPRARVSVAASRSGMLDAQARCYAGKLSHACARV